MLNPFHTKYIFPVNVFAAVAFRPLLNPFLGAGPLMAQDKLWSNGGQLVDGNDPLTPAFPCAFPTNAGMNRYHGQVGRYDENGKLPCFLVDGTVYDHQGYRMADNEAQPSSCFNRMVRGSQEVRITRMPGTCDTYDILGGNIKNNHPTTEHLAVVKLVTRP